ncbi:isocitrate/isopropylmalate dehydrogenase family protein [Candidatus Pyrohabitans sp.]
MYRIAVIPGDGIGPEVMQEGIKVLEAAGEVTGADFEWIRYPFGAEHYLATGEVLPEDALKEISGCDAIYLAAVGDPRVKPGILEQGILLKLRFYFDQYVNLRPVKLYPGIPTPLKDKKPEDINFFVVRENTEDFYVGVGARVTSAKQREELEVKRELYQLKFGVDITKEGSEEIAFQIGVVSREGARRVIEYAFELAKRQGMQRVTSVDKANVLTHVYSLWREVFEDVARGYAGIETEFTFVDAITMYFLTMPEHYRVVVTPNMFGDIITDLGAQIQGGIGLAPSGNINPQGVSMFEPVHGSAPNLKGRGLANPIAQVLAGQLMLQELGEAKAARLVERAVYETLREGVRTPDIAGSASTTQVGDAIAAKVKELADNGD